MDDSIVSNKMHISVSMSCFIARLAVLLQLIVVDRKERGAWYCQCDTGWELVSEGEGQ